MNRIVKIILAFITLVLFQVLVFNNISLWGYITPYPYLYFLLMLRVDINKSVLLFIGFFTGLTIDIFQNTLGMQAAATTALVFARPGVLNFYFKTVEFFPKEEPGISRLGFWGYLKYAFTLVLIHNIVLFLLETFSFQKLFLTLKMAFFNAMVTTVTILIIEMLFHKKENR